MDGKVKFSVIMYRRESLVPLKTGRLVSKNKEFFETTSKTLFFHRTSPLLPDARETSDALGANRGISGKLEPRRRSSGITDAKLLDGLFDEDDTQHSDAKGHSHNTEGNDKIEYKKRYEESEARNLGLFEDLTKLREELEQLKNGKQHLENDKQRLHEENETLIRIISKLSK